MFNPVFSSASRSKESPGQIPIIREALEEHLPKKYNSIWPHSTKRHQKEIERAANQLKTYGVEKEGKVYGKMRTPVYPIDISKVASNVRFDRIRELENALFAENPGQTSESWASKGLKIKELSALKRSEYAFYLSQKDKARAECALTQIQYLHNYYFKYQAFILESEISIVEKQVYEVIEGSQKRLEEIAPILDHLNELGKQSYKLYRSSFDQNKLFFYGCMEKVADLSLALDPTAKKIAATESAGKTWRSYVDNWMYWMWQPSLPSGISEDFAFAVVDSDGTFNASYPIFALPGTTDMSLAVGGWNNCQSVKPAWGSNGFYDLVKGMQKGTQTTEEQQFFKSLSTSLNQYPGAWSKVVLDFENYGEEFTGDNQWKYTQFVTDTYNYLKENHPGISLDIAVSPNANNRRYFDVDALKALGIGFQVMCYDYAVGQDLSNIYAIHNAPLYAPKNVAADPGNSTIITESISDDLDKMVLKSGESETSGKVDPSQITVGVPGYGVTYYIDAGKSIQDIQDGINQRTLKAWCYGSENGQITNDDIIQKIGYWEAPWAPWQRFMDGYQGTWLYNSSSGELISVTPPETINQILGEWIKTNHPDIAGFFEWEFIGDAGCTVNQLMQEYSELTSANPVESEAALIRVIARRILKLDQSFQKIKQSKTKTKLEKQQAKEIAQKSLALKSRLVRHMQFLMETQLYGIAKGNQKLLNIGYTPGSFAPISPKQTEEVKKVLEARVSDFLKMHDEMMKSEALLPQGFFRAYITNYEKQVESLKAECRHFGVNTDALPALIPSAPPCSVDSKKLLAEAVTVKGESCYIDMGLLYGQWAYTTGIVWWPTVYIDQGKLDDLLNDLISTLKASGIQEVRYSFAQMSDIQILLQGQAGVAGAWNDTIALIYQDGYVVGDGGTLNFFEYTTQKMKDNQIRNNLSFGGALAGSTEVVLPEDATQAANDLVSYMDKTNIDSVDFDIEGGTENTFATEANKTFLSVLHSKLSETSKQSTITLEGAVSSGPAGYLKDLFGDNFSTYFDAVNLMLYGGAGGQYYISADNQSWGIKQWLSYVGNDPKKISIGFYDSIAYESPSANADGNYSYQVSGTRGNAAAQVYAQMCQNLGYEYTLDSFLPPFIWTDSPLDIPTDSFLTDFYSGLKGLGYTL